MTAFPIIAPGVSGIEMNLRQALMEKELSLTSELSVLNLTIEIIASKQQAAWSVKK